MGDRVTGKRSAKGSVYMLSVRAVLLALIGVLVVGGIGGAGAAWFVIRDTMRGISVTPQVIERIEETNKNGANGDIQSVAADVRKGIVNIVDRNGNISQTALVLTSDGIAVTPMRATVPRPPNVRLHDGSIVVSAIIREYPEVGLLFIRVPGSFPAPVLGNANDVAPGKRSIIITQSDIPEVDAVRETSIETIVIPGKKYNFPVGMSHAAFLPNGIPASYSGAPLYGFDRKVLGLLYPYTSSGAHQETSFGVMPVTLIEFALQDILRNPEKEPIPVFSGIEGEWIVHSSRHSAAFSVNAITQGSSFAQAGIRPGDLVVAEQGKSFKESGVLWSVLLKGARSGESIDIDIERGDETLERSVQIEI